jgi:2-(1,2-epoxy-1,2-dihydrophenyl)acetyl-CoA isomerase
MVGIDVGSTDVDCELADGVLTVSFARPAVRNTLSLGMLTGLAAALESAETRDDVRVLVLTGNGSTFCAGGDLGLMAQGGSIFDLGDDLAARAQHQVDVQRATVVRLRECSKPTVAVVRGAAVGAGLGLALACDIRYMASTAVLMTGFARAALAGDFGCSWLLHDLAGRSVAAELMYRSHPVSAEEAVRAGLANSVFADDDLDAEARARVRQMARVPATASAAIASALRQAPTASFVQACDRDVASHVRLTRTQEHIDASRALISSMKGL